MAPAKYRKSSYSNEERECVQIATTRHTITIRDSKHPTGPTLHLTPTAWASFLAGLNAETRSQPAAPTHEPVTAALTKQMSPVGAGANPGPH
ncbi:hypothetical protein DMH18_33905 [Streptomyces sp. WAC 06783]|uniref:DUF397 domain-containing protein n=1 Tax=Streptomyces sp. WAC 06783 TaxID=2203211 RepID=UPI000F737E88|nr:DUF397 domain-containing protein [Streptomyces sp. WAC 06783]RSO04574.1 hypothetical protein DMH18_33905 [Streptomyces sp. WAC 06783]